MDPGREVRFDGWTLDRRAGELVREGRRTRLQGRSLMVLEALLERPGELVTREELIARLWPQGVVDFDTALNSAVRRLRAALGDHAETPQYVETIPRRGYRLIVEVEAALPAADATGTESPSPEAAPRPAAPRPRASELRAWWPRVAVFLALLAVGLGLASQRSALPPPPAGPTRTAAVSGNAEDLYQRARHLFQRRAPGDVERAGGYFAAAVEADPGHARAWAGLAGTYWLGTIEGRFPPEEGLARLRDAAERALALDPRLAEAHLRLANYRGSIGDLGAQEQHLRVALELEPGNAMVLGMAASLEASAGRLDAAVRLQRRALAAEPLSSLHRYNLASYLLLAGDLRGARQELQSLRELHSAPSVLRNLLALVELLEGNFEEALAQAAVVPDDAERLGLAAMAHHGLGRHAESDDALRALLAATPQDPLLIAEVHSFRGEADLAFGWLQAAVARGPAKPWENPALRRLPLATYSPLFASLRADPRWQAWIASAGLDSLPSSRASLAMRGDGQEGSRR